MTPTKDWISTQARTAARSYATAGRIPPNPYPAGSEEADQWWRHFLRWHLLETSLLREREAV